MKFEEIKVVQFVEIKFAVRVTIHFIMKIRLLSGKNLVLRLNYHEQHSCAKFYLNFRGIFAGKLSRNLNRSRAVVNFCCGLPMMKCTPSKSNQ